METLGRYLKAHREKAGMKLETMAYQTKVRLTLLQDLEADRFDRLPQGGLPPWLRSCLRRFPAPSFGPRFGTAGTRFGTTHIRGSGG